MVSTSPVSLVSAKSHWTHLLFKVSAWVQTLCHRIASLPNETLAPLQHDELTCCYYTEHRCNNRTFSSLCVLVVVAAETDLNVALGTSSESDTRSSMLGWDKSLWTLRDYTRTQYNNGMGRSPVADIPAASPCCAREGNLITSLQPVSLLLC